MEELLLTGTIGAEGGGGGEVGSLRYRELAGRSRGVEVRLRLVGGASMVENICWKEFGSALEEEAADSLVGSFGEADS